MVATFASPMIAAVLFLFDSLYRGLFQSLSINHDFKETETATAKQLQTGEHQNAIATSRR